MPLSEQAHRRLAGFWGSYDFNLIKDKHFVTAADLAERFLEKYTARWSRSHERLDLELTRENKAVRRLIEAWAQSKLQRILTQKSSETLRTHIMFKRLHYGHNSVIGFGSDGLNWRRKEKIAEELLLYRPWSISHAIDRIGNSAALYQHFRQIVRGSGSPAELIFFDAWRALNLDKDRPALFPQVQGHTSGKFWQLNSQNETRPLHFDFGLVNVVSRQKLIIEIDSRRYHSHDQEYPADRDRQNIAEEAGWSVRRFTYQEVTQRIDHCFTNIGPHLYYEEG